jgi:hypothetical protein
MVDKEARSLPRRRKISREGASDLQTIGDLFARASFEASAHVCTYAEGQSARYVPDDRKAWHCVSCNSAALGVEQIGFAPARRMARGADQGNSPVGRSLGSSPWSADPQGPDPGSAGAAFRGYPTASSVPLGAGIPIPGQAIRWVICSIWLASTKVSSNGLHERPDRQASTHLSAKPHRR